MKILVVEDEPVLRDGLVDLLTSSGHEVEAVGDGAAAVERGTADAFELILLDWMLPKLEGPEVCRKLKTVRPALPIIMLTAKGSEEDKVKGLKIGADDYMTKPFGIKELLARVEAVGRRARASETDSDELAVDGCVLDLGRCEAQRGETPVSLTPREVGILRWLHRFRKRAVSRAELLESVWGVPGTLETRTVDMAIANLRQKIESDAAHPRIIVSVKGVGYAWGESWENR